MPPKLPHGIRAEKDVTRTAIAHKCKQSIEVRLVEVIQMQIACADGGNMQQFHERNGRRIVRRKANAREVAVIGDTTAAPVTDVSRMKKWVMHAVAMPETHAVRVVLLNKAKGYAPLHVPRIVRIQSYEDEPRLLRTRALVWLRSE